MEQQLHTGQHTSSECLERRLRHLGGQLEAVEARSSLLSECAQSAEAQATSYAERLVDAHRRIAELEADSLRAELREESLSDEVCAVRGALEAAQLQAVLSQGSLRRKVAEERLRGERARLAFCEACAQRDEALEDLGEAYADLDAMRATLADTALYVSLLRRRVLAYELRDATSLGASDSPGANSQGAFSLQKTQEAIRAAVLETAGLAAEERKKKIRQLQLRWHPDKNPVLRDFATEVTKIINEAAAEMESRQPEQQQAQPPSPHQGPPQAREKCSVWPQAGWPASGLKSEAVACSPSSSSSGSSDSGSPPLNAFRRTSGVPYSFL